jgi:hypothetical protein
MLSLAEHRQQIEDLIAQNRVEAARDYCRKLSHPNARLWLSEINRLFPAEMGRMAQHPYRLSDGEVDPEYLARLNIVLDVSPENPYPKLKHEPPYYPDESSLSINQILGLGLLVMSLAVIIGSVAFLAPDEVMSSLCLYGMILVFIVFAGMALEVGTDET